MFVFVFDLFCSYTAICGRILPSFTCMFYVCVYFTNCNSYHRTHPGQPSTEGTFSAQNLIDAIIKHQISQNSTEPTAMTVNRDLSRPSFVSSNTKLKQTVNIYLFLFLFSLSLAFAFVVQFERYCATTSCHKRCNIFSASERK